jgi:pimeloyl-ACP methyl ester carboxylesterase/protein-tyrosine-phosphatase
MAHVLFVCLHNAGRSQMSRALFERAAGGRHTAQSAGTTPAERVHPQVLQAMSEVGVDLSDRVPQLLTDELAGRADVLVTMGCGDQCPYFPGKRYIDWDLPDPSGRPIEEVRRTRDAIEGLVAGLIAELDELDPRAFAVERAEVREGVHIAYVRAGAGGYPLLLVHGWPETKRIWWRNIAPLAAAGFEVIVPDLRGFGDSGLAPDGFYDVAAHARDMRALLCDVLGHDRCATAGGDLGGAVVQDLGLRFDGLVERQVLFNSVMPLLGAEYEAAGVASAPSREVRMAADYFLRQGREADTLAKELDSSERRRRYVGEFYGHRFWAAPGAFSSREIDFMTEPFADADRLRAGWGNYESALGTRPLSEAPRLFEVSSLPTLALYGPDDHVIWREFPQMCEVAFSELIGPFVVPRAGHFLQWERAGLFNRTVAYFLRDLAAR